MDKMDAIIDSIKIYMKYHSDCNGINEDLERYADLDPAEISSIKRFLLYSSDGDNDAVRSGFRKIILAFHGILSLKKNLANRLEQINKNNKQTKILTITLIIISLFLIAVLSFSMNTSQ